MEERTPGEYKELCCRDVGVDCDFTARAVTVQEVIDACVDHAVNAHDMKGFDRNLYLKMRAHIRIVPA